MKKLMFVAALAAMSMSAFAEKYAYDITLTLKATQPKAEKSVTYTVTLGEDVTGLSWYRAIGVPDAKIGKRFIGNDDENKEFTARGVFKFNPETGTSDFDYPIKGGEKPFTLKYKAASETGYYLDTKTVKVVQAVVFDSKEAEKSISGFTAADVALQKVLFGGMTLEKSKKVLVHGSYQDLKGIVGTLSGQGKIDKDGKIASVSGTFVGALPANEFRNGKVFYYDIGFKQYREQLAEGCSVSGTFTMKYNKKVSDLYNSLD